MTEAAWDAGLPVLTTCEGCGGKCCSEMRTPPFTRIGADIPPAHLLAAVDAAVMEPLDVRPELSPCLWLTADGKCRHYAWRPNVCRTFQRGGPACRRWRGELSADADVDFDDDGLNFEPSSAGRNAMVDMWAERRRTGADDVTAEQPLLDDDELVVHYTPSAIRDHFEESSHAAAIAAMTDDELREVGERVLESDATWMAFHVALCAALEFDPDAALPG